MAMGPAEEIRSLEARLRVAQEALALPSPETLAMLFHRNYERLAPEHGWETRDETRVPWQALPENMRKLMVAVAEKILEEIRNPPV